MMKRAMPILLFLVAGLAFAANLTVTIPSAAVPNAQDMCEELRLELRIRTADWTNDVCASFFTRIGVRVFVGRVERRGLVQQQDAAVQAALDQFDADWPPLMAAATCGDGVLDTEFGEECDDGNLVDGDGCDGTCSIEP
jgi:cysteine-rich repeat protein